MDDQPGEQQLVAFEPTGQQHIALMALAGGAHVLEAAAEARVARETVSRWLAQPGFRAELLRRREELWQKYQAELIGLVPDALAALGALMRGYEYTGDEHYDPRVRLEAAQTVLRISGLLPQRGGPGLAVQINNVVGTKE